MTRIAVIMMVCGAVACGGGSSSTAPADCTYLLERVDAVAVVQVYADSLYALPLADKTVVWHLYQATLAGRDLFYDRKHPQSVDMRDVIEAVVGVPKSAASFDRTTLAEIQRYTKLFWIHSGPYDTLTGQKFVLTCTPEAFAAAAHTAENVGARFPLQNGETLDQLLARLRPMFFDPAVDPIVTNQHRLRGTDDGPQIAAITQHLEAAIPLATEPMAQALRALLTFYRTRETKDLEAYRTARVQDEASPLGTIDSFIDLSFDSRVIEGALEMTVFYVNRTKTSAIRKLAEHAQWFEDRMPWDPKYRRQGVQAITANAIDVIFETGNPGPIVSAAVMPDDAVMGGPYRSKRVSWSNVDEAYEQSTLPSFRREFSWTPDEAERATKWTALAGELTTNLHEVIGHAATGEERPNGGPHTALQEQFSALEEARADLVALHVLPDRKLAELGLVPTADQDEIVRAGYEEYTRSALVQLRRVQGTTIAEDRLRSRQMIVHWLKANTGAVDVRTRDGKTYYVMRDATAFRDGAGRLLAEVQRITAEGDNAAAKQLFDTYGSHVDSTLRDEVVARAEKLNLPSSTAFVMPFLAAAADPSGRITSLILSYPQDLSKQMLEYAWLARELRKQVAR